MVDSFEVRMARVEASLEACGLEVCAWPENVVRSFVVDNGDVVCGEVAECSAGLFVGRAAGLSFAVVSDDASSVFGWVRSNPGFEFV